MLIFSDKLTTTIQIIGVGKKTHQIQVSQVSQKILKRSQMMMKVNLIYQQKKNLQRTKMKKNVVSGNGLGDQMTFVKI
jgi:hypothetical protein